MLLWQQLGAAVIVGFGFMLATVPLNAVIVRKTMQYQVCFIFPKLILNVHHNPLFALYLATDVFIQNNSLDKYI